MRPKILLSVIFLLLIMHADLCALITSRVKGVVRDAETGQAIHKAKVFLFIYRPGSYYRQPHYETVTDKDGKFLFDGLKNDRYFVMCEHEDYLLSLPERKLSHHDLSSIVDLFDLQQGQIKHLEIQLLKGGKIKGRVLLKDEKGITGAKLVFIFLINQHVKNHRDPLRAFFDSNGNFLIGSLIPDDNYRIRIIKTGFPEFEADVVVKKGETTYIEHTVDATDNSGVFGTVTLNGKPHFGCGVHIWDFINSKNISDTRTNDEGKFLVKDMNPGYYRILIIRIDDDQNIYKKSINIELEKNEMKQINIDF